MTSMHVAGEDGDQDGTGRRIAAGRLSTILPLKESSLEISSFWPKSKPVNQRLNIQIHVPIGCISGHGSRCGGEETGSEGS